MHRAELTALFRRLKEKEIATSLDLAAVDPASEAGQADWAGILENVLPLTDQLMKIGTKAVLQGKSPETTAEGAYAATASHFCNDLIKGCRVGGQPGFRVECLCDSLAVVTCLANDFSYENIYRIQLETKAHAGDIFIGLSGSGNSGNVVAAAKTAREMGMTVIGFLGCDSGKLKPLRDRYVIAPTDSMEQLEDMHMLYCHALSCLLQKRLAE